MYAAKVEKGPILRFELTMPSLTTPQKTAKVKADFSNRDIDKVIAAY
jgi:hypothetical protein